jgi:23S rRNA (adenine2503-C2)-methyltransferase
VAKSYARATGYPIQYQWTLLEGVNDGDDELDGIVELLAGKYAMLNMIPYNTVPGTGSAGPRGSRRARWRRGCWRAAC